MISPANHRILPNIVYQHTENTSFLFLQRDQAVDAPNYTRQAIAELDERIEANIDGLRIAGAEGYQIALEQLEANQEPGELFTCSLLALEAHDQERFNPLAQIGRENEEACLGLRGAIGWCDATRLKPWVQPWLDSLNPLERYLGIVACSLHRADPGARLADFLRDEDPQVRSRAARLVGELGRTDLRDLLMPLLDDSLWAAWSLGLVGERAAIPQLQKLAESGCDHAMQVVVRLMSVDLARSWIRRLNGDPSKLPMIIRASGLLGDPQAVPWLISKMEDDEISQAAGNSFYLITGLFFERDELNRQKPASLDDADLIQTSTDDRYRWPDQNACGRCWLEHASQYNSGDRYFLGKRSNLLDHAVRDLSQETLIALAYNKAIINREMALQNSRSKYTNYQK